MQKQINARLVQKSGFESEWLLATNFIPINGELIVYKAEADQNGNLFTDVTLPVGRTTPYTYARFKIGDGYTLVNDLPFFAGEGNGASQAQADWAQTNEEAADFIKNKPFGEYTPFDPIEWSSSMTTNPSVEIEYYSYYLISTKVPTKEELMDSSITFSVSGEEYNEETGSYDWITKTYNKTISSFSDIHDGAFAFYASEGWPNNIFYVFPQAITYDCNGYSVSIDTPGIYAIHADTSFIKLEAALVIKKIDEKFLPEISVPSGSGLPEVTTEDNGSFLRVINGEWQIVQINVYDGSVV